MSISPKMQSALIIASGSMLGYLYSQATGKDHILWMTFGTLLGKFAEDIIMDEPTCKTA